MSKAAIGHGILRQLVRSGARAYRKNLHSVEQIQKEKLTALLSAVAASPSGKNQGIRSDWSWEDFSKNLPVTRYANWSENITEQMSSGKDVLIQSPVMRYQPTSGSSSAIKWIPYTKKFLSELDGAISPWLADIYERFPGSRKGVHYWSLSWLPTDMREQVGGHLNDDMKLLSFGKRWVMGHTQAVPESISLAATSDDSMFATLAYLASRQDLSAMSVWSPTFGLGLIERLSEWREPLAEVLKTGQWGARSGAMGDLTAPRNKLAAEMLASWDGAESADFYSSLWPELALISAWDTAAAAPWAQKLQKLLPQAGFQGKGLWATEGVVTIPQGHQHVLAVNSHVYEFEDADSGEIIPPWKLDKGQEVVPLMSTGSGLLRYRLGDRLRVSGHVHDAPTLEFLGRADTVDMVGEKISTVDAQRVLDAIHWPAGTAPVVLLGAQKGGKEGHPAYVLLVEADPSLSTEQTQAIEKGLALEAEQALLSNFHYKLARNLGQLDAAGCICRVGAQVSYLEGCLERGMIEGNIKVEALKAWPGDLPGGFKAASTRKQMSEESNE